MFFSFRVDLVVRQVQLVQGPGRRTDPDGQHAGRGTGQPLRGPAARRLMGYSCCEWKMHGGIPNIPGRLIWRFFEMNGRIMGDEFLGVLYTGDEWE